MKYLTPIIKSDVNNPKNIRLINNHIIFKNVGFKYNNTDVLSNINLTKKGNVALVGKSEGNQL